jgi:hypothetical protein
MELFDQFCPKFREKKLQAGGGGSVGPVFDGRCRSRCTDVAAAVGHGDIELWQILVILISRRLVF